MATTEAATAAVQNGEQEQQAQVLPTGDLVTDKSTVRAYWKWVTVKVKNKKTGLVTEKTKAKFIAKAETPGQENWKKIEEEKDKDGNAVWNFFSENSFERYTVKTMAAFNALVLEEQQPYICNSGVNYVQNSKMNSMAVEPKEGTGINGIPPEPAHNQEDIDLREAINEKPGRRLKTNEEKAEEMLQKLGMDAASIAQFLGSLQAKYAAAAASGVALPPSEDDESEEEEEGEEEGEENTVTN